MAEKGGVYVLDEPTTGLHLADVEQLLGLLDRLVDSGKSVIVIEHHQAVMAHADWIIDLGPGAGHDGGRVVFEGTPADLVAAPRTLTGEHLAAYVGGRSAAPRTYPPPHGRASTQNSWPSALARHVHGTSPWPTSRVGGAQPPAAGADLRLLGRHPGYGSRSRWTRSGTVLASVERRNSR